MLSAARKASSATLGTLYLAGTRACFFARTKSTATSATSTNAPANNSAAWPRVK